MDAIAAWKLKQAAQRAERKRIFDEARAFLQHVLVDRKMERGRRGSAAAAPARDEDGMALLWGKGDTVTLVLDSGRDGGAFTVRVNGRALENDFEVVGVFDLLDEIEVRPAVCCAPCCWEEDDIGEEEDEDEDLVRDGEDPEADAVYAGGAYDLTGYLKAVGQDGGQGGSEDAVELIQDDVREAFAAEEILLSRLAALQGVAVEKVLPSVPGYLQLLREDESRVNPGRTGKSTLWASALGCSIREVEALPDTIKKVLLPAWRLNFTPSVTIRISEMEAVRRKRIRDKQREAEVRQRLNQELYVKVTQDTVLFHGPDEAAVAYPVRSEEEEAFERSVRESDLTEGDRPDGGASDGGSVSGAEGEGSSLALSPVPIMLPKGTIVRLVGPLEQHRQEPAVLDGRMKRVEPELIFNDGAWRPLQSIDHLPSGLYIAKTRLEEANSYVRRMRNYFEMTGPQIRSYNLAARARVLRDTLVELISSREPTNLSEVQAKIGELNMIRAQLPLSICDICTIRRVDPSTVDPHALAMVRASLPYEGDVSDEWDDESDAAFDFERTSGFYDSLFSSPSGAAPIPWGAAPTPSGAAPSPWAQAPTPSRAAPAPWGATFGFAPPVAPLKKPAKSGARVPEPSSRVQEKEAAQFAKQSEPPARAARGRAGTRRTVPTPRRRRRRTCERSYGCTRSARMFRWATGASGRRSARRRSASSRRPSRQ